MAYMYITMGLYVHVYMYCSEAPGPTYLFKYNNKNFTTFLLLLVSLVMRGGRGGAAPGLRLLVKGKRRA
jgi:hypothetical protein